MEHSQGLGQLRDSYLRVFFAPELLGIAKALSGLHCGLSCSYSVFHPPLLLSQVPDQRYLKAEPGLCLPPLSFVSFILPTLLGNSYFPKDPA